MLSALLRRSVRHRAVVLLLAALLLALGTPLAAGMPLDVFPDLDRPTVTVLTEAEALAPEEVDARVTRPLEGALGGLPGVAHLRARSAPGLSSVTVGFDWDVDPTHARQRVAERLSTAGGRLPAGIAPALAPMASIMGEVLLEAYLPGEGATAPEVRGWVDRSLRPVLLATAGVAQVAVVGGGVEELQVEVDPGLLAGTGRTFAEVVDAAADAQGRASAGVVGAGDSSWIGIVDARAHTPEALAATPLDGAGALRLGNVARVRMGVAPRVGEGGADGERAIVVSVQKQPGVDTLALTQRLEAVFQQVDPQLPAGTRRATLFRQADFVTAAVDNVEVALRDGAILVAVVLVLFLGEWRATVISLLAIPLSFVLAALVLRVLGLGVNTMTLGGLAVAVGELVDDAIVDVENVHRRLREARGIPLTAAGLTARVVAASEEVRGSIVFSTILVVLVFVPLLALPGVEGRLFFPLGVAYIVAILASLLVSLTVTPALARWLLPPLAARPQEEDETRLVRGLKRLHRAALARTLPRPVAVIAGCVALVGGTMLAVPHLGRAFLPPFAEGTATVNLMAAPGTSLEASDTLGAAAERLLREVPEVVGTGRRTGRAEMDEHAEGVHASEIEVRLRDLGRDRKAVLADLRSALGGIPGLQVAVGQPIAHRLDHLLSGVQAAIAVKVFGEDGIALRQAVAQVAQTLEGVSGVVDVRPERQDVVPALRVDVNRETAGALGVRAGSLSEELAGAIGGVRAATIIDGARTLGVRVRWAAPWREDPAAMAAAPWVLEDGRSLPLGVLARVEQRGGPAEIAREDGRRRVVVAANVSGTDVGETTDAVQQALEALRLPEGVSLRVEGQAAGQREATRRVALLAGVSLLGMLLVLRAHTRAWSLALQVLLSVPLALVGAVGAIFVSGQPLSVATAIGLVTLCGIATRNTILLVDHYVHLARDEGMAFGPELVVRGSLERLVPVSMTALTAGIALLPLALSAGEPGREILAPVAQVILGGLISSTLLDLVVTPTLFLRWGGDALAHVLAPPRESE